MQASRGAAVDDLTAMHARAWANVDHVISTANGVFVVFNDDHGIAEVAQAGQGLEQSVIVALMQANRGLIEHVHHAHQAGTNLTGEANALRFATRQRVGLAIKR